ncbi:MAG: hypothetical protein AAF985_26870, partial [Bacteroidota bacterium]
MEEKQLPKNTIDGLKYIAKQFDESNNFRHCKMEFDVFLDVLIKGKQLDLENLWMYFRHRLLVFFKETLRPELSYYRECSTKWVRDATSLLVAGQPVHYETKLIKNPTLRSLLVEKQLKLSVDYKDTLKIFDNFFQDQKMDGRLRKMATLRENDPANDFYQVKQAVITRLEKIKVRRYNLLYEYLHSIKFTNTTDRLQVYGGALGIWDQEGRELVRIQDRNYMRDYYRPRFYSNDPWYEANNLTDMWYDLPERYLNEQDFRWEDNPYADSINMMFFAERKQLLQPEFYQNFSSERNILNDIEKREQFLFCEDGEVGAFILLYRFLNAMVHTPIDLNASKAEEESKGEDPIFAKLLGEIREKYIALLDYHQAIGLSVSDWCVYKPEELNSPDLKCTYLDYVIMLCHCFDQAEGKEEEEENCRNILGENWYGDVLKKANKMMEHIFNTDHQVKFNFSEKKLSDQQNGNAYDRFEDRARKEQFYLDIQAGIDRGAHTLLEDLGIQGLIFDSLGKGYESSANLIKITERYINLCRFIEKELNPLKREYKVKSNFSGYKSTINPEQYFIDQGVNKINRKDNGNFYRGRVQYLADIRSKIVRT